MNLAIFQSACGGVSEQERLNRLRAALEGRDVDLVVCPELFASGYNVGDDLRSLAQPLDGDWLKQLGAIAGEFNTHIVYGYPERCDGQIYNAAACVSPAGQCVANHRKRANSPGSFEETYFTPGDRMTTFDCNGIKVGILICYEVEFPEPVREAALDGVQLVVVPTALVAQWGVVANRIVPTRAFENGIWVAYANHGGDENGFTYLGGSRIVAPQGTDVAVAGQGEELIVAEIDLDKVTAAQARLPYLRDVKRFQTSDPA